MLPAIRGPVDPRQRVERAGWRCFRAPRPVRRRPVRAGSVRSRSPTRTASQRWEQPPMHVAMTGSSGLVGTALRERLTAADHQVTRIVHGRQGEPGVSWDPAAGWMREGLFDGADAVVHLAAASIGESRWTESRKRLLRESRIQGTRLLVDGLAAMDAAARPRVLVSASAVGFYGDRGDEELAEDAPSGDGFLAQLVRDWEAEARRAEDLGMRGVLLRSGVVLSPKAGAIKKMLLPFRLGVGGTVAGGQQWISWITLQDEVSVIMHLLDSDLSGAVNSAAPAVRSKEFTDALGRALGRPTIFPIPGFAMKALYGQMGDETLLWSQRVAPRKLEDRGFRFAHPEINEAMRAVLGKDGG
ncbi:MAG: TIGR01777 family protein [Dehalococcoidia bacterium]|nr:TIGR01777 family protein [Dehalococcoidia bacterium]